MTPDQLAAKLRQAAKVLHPTSMAHTIGTEAMHQAQEALETEGASIGESWPQRLPGTPKPERRILEGMGSATLLKSIQFDLRVNQVVIGVGGAKVPYAQIQNEGGTIPVTPAMRRFFWAKYYQYAGRAEKHADSTQDSRIRTYSALNKTAEMYKNLALTKKTALEIPRRTFLKPDMARLRVAVNRQIEAQLTALLR